MKVTRNEVVSAVKATLAVIRHWEAADAPNVAWHGQATKQMSQAVESALDDLCEYCGATEVDDDAKEVIMAIDAVQTEFVAWAQAVDISPEAVHPSGTPELRTAIRGLSEALAVHQVRLPEEIRDLMEAGVGDEQICKIYGFLDENGAPNMVMLSEEKRKPGAHFNAETWTPPAQKRRQREINERWSQRVFAGHERVGSAPAKPRPVAPESLDELIASNVEAEQIARMKGITIEEVEAYARERQLPIAGRTFRSPEKADEAKAELAKRRAELIPRSHPEVSNMEDRILACALDEMKPTEIAEALQLDYPDLSWQRVAAIIRKFEK